MEITLATQCSRAPARRWAGLRRRGNRRQNTRENLARAWRAPRHGHIRRYDVRYAAAARIALAKDSSGAAAVADRHHQLRVRCRVVGPPQRHFHISGDWPRDQQQIRMPRARDEPDAQGLEIVEWVVERVDF